MTAVKEANQGFAHKIEPCVLCSYDVDCEDVVDLRTDEARAASGVSTRGHGRRMVFVSRGGTRAAVVAHRAPTHRRKAAGVLAPSYAPGATAADHNLVLWTWSDRPPHRIAVFDPTAGCRGISSPGADRRRRSLRASPNPEPPGHPVSAIRAKRAASPLGNRESRHVHGPRRHVRTSVVLGSCL